MSQQPVTVHATSDPIEADILADIMRQHGLDPRVLGTRHGALIGVAQHILKLRIEVPVEQATEAAAIVRAFLEAPPEGEAALEGEVDGQEDGDETEGGAVDPAAAGSPRLRPLLAAGAVVAIFGGSHIYARRPWTALGLAAGQLVALGTAVAGDGHAPIGALLAFVGLLAMDLIGGQLAVRAFNRGARPSRARQAAAGLAMIGLVGVSAVVVAPRIRLGAPPSPIDDLYLDLQVPPPELPLLRQDPLLELTLPLPGDAGPR